MNDSSKRHSQFVSLIFILNCLSKASEKNGEKAKVPSKIYHFDVPFQELRQILKSKQNSQRTRENSYS